LEYWISTKENKIQM